MSTEAVPVIATQPCPIEFPDAVMYGISDALFGVFGPLLTGFEAAFREYLPQGAEAIDQFLVRERHPLAANFPLANPYYALCVFCLYFVGIVIFFVLGKLFGPCKLRTYGILHNVVLTAWSLYMAVGVVWEAVNQDFGFWTDKVGSGPVAHSMAKFCWLFYVSKIPEYADTYIMLLKQNYRQVSFLHVFHHASILLIWTLALNTAPGGGSYFGVFQNSAVHVIMYLYYLLNLMFSSEKSAIRRFLQKHKFYITYLQLLQFLLNVGQAVYNLFIAEEPYNRVCMQVNLLYMIVLIILFGNFLVRGKQDRKRASAAAKAVKSSPNAKKSS